MSDSDVESTEDRMPGTGHGHRSVITVHRYASETNVSSISGRCLCYLKLPLASLFISFEFFFFPIPFSLFSKQLCFTPTTTDISIFQHLFQRMVGPASSQGKKNDKLSARSNAPQVGNKAEFPKLWSLDHERKRKQCRRLMIL